MSSTLGWFGFEGILYIVSWVASAIIYIIGWLLKAAANLFDALVQYTVVDFGGTLTSFNILNGVQTVWSAFRDISNIAIIGMFVFVAISMILGNSSFGTRRFVARVLLVAVLINFSLLFTKLVIDASHVVARQFYNGIVSVAPASGTQQQGQATDIAKAFLDRAGLTSGFDTAAKLRDIGRKQDGLSALLAYALTIGTFMMAFAISFIYGSYLLALRAVLLLFLLLTSSLAFASNLIPKFREHRYGWSGWWDALIKNALLAPLMMMFLWAALTVLQPRPGGGTIGAFFNNPADTTTWGALIMYLLVAGMLFLSLKLASSFSTSIPGFSAISGSAKTGLGGLGLLLGGLGGMATRATVGRGAKALYERSRGGYMEQGGMVGRDLKVKAGVTPRADITTTKGIRQALDRFGSQALKTTSTSSFNAARAGTALSEKYKDIMRKQAGAFDGKGGVVAADKTKKEAQKKTSQEAFKELVESTKNTEQARQEETRKVFEKNLTSIADERRIAAEQAGKEKDSVRTQQKEVQDTLKNQKTDVEKREKSLAGKTGKIFDEQRDVLKAEKSRIERETQESQAKIEDAERKAKEAEENARNQAALEKEAYKKADEEVKKTEKESEPESIEVKFTAEEGFEREKFRSMYLSKRKEESRKKRVQETLGEMVDKDEEDEKPPIVGDIPKAPGGEAPKTPGGGGAGEPKK